MCPPGPARALFSRRRPRARRRQLLTWWAGAIRSVGDTGDTGAIDEHGARFREVGSALQAAGHGAELRLGRIPAECGQTRHERSQFVTRDRLPLRIELLIAQPHEGAAGMEPPGRVHAKGSVSFDARLQKSRLGRLERAVRVAPLNSGEAIEHQGRGGPDPEASQKNDDEKPSRPVEERQAPRDLRRAQRRQGLDLGS